jgi:hypothetical protein
MSTISSTEPLTHKVFKVQLFTFVIYDRLCEGIFEEGWKLNNKIIIKHKIKRKNENEKGSIIFHMNDINWSYLNRGNTPLINTIKKQNTNVLIPNPKAAKLRIVLFVKINGKTNPPQKKIAIKLDIRTMLEYSAKKKKTKGTEAYSVM